MRRGGQAIYLTLSGDCTAKTNLGLVYHKQSKGCAGLPSRASVMLSGGGGGSTPIDLHHCSREGSSVGNCLLSMAANCSSVNAPRTGT